MSQQQQLILLVGMAAALIGAAIVIVLRVVNQPEKRERKRRQQVNQLGRLGEALITEVSEELLHYSYSLSGVQYHASQDIRPLRAMLPPDLDKLIGPARIKYLTRNPANSILLCEEWSGVGGRANAA